MLCVLFICVLCEKKYVILYLSLCHSVLQKSPVSLPHSVILSYKNHQFLSLTLLFCLQKTSVSLCHYVIMSSKKHLSLSVPLLFCLTKITSFSPSLCYSVFKKTSVPLCPSVILSSRPPLLSLLSSCYSVFKITLSTFVFRSLCRPSEDTELR